MTTATCQPLAKRRYQAASYRGRWFVEHDTPRVSRRWALWLLRELGCQRRPKKCAPVACTEAL